MENRELAHRFTYFSSSETLSPEQTEEAYSLVRDAVGAAANIVNKMTPDSREKSLAVTKLEEAMFWANAGIARNGVGAGGKFVG